jgi:hypothetical protein
LEVYVAEYTFTTGLDTLKPRFGNLIAGCWRAQATNASTQGQDDYKIGTEEASLSELR